MDRAALVRALEATLAANDEVIDNAMKDAERLGYSPYEMKNKDGSYAMAPLLHTRAMVLSSLTALRSV